MRSFLTSDKVLHHPIQTVSTACIDFDCSFCAGKRIGDMQDPLSLSPSTIRLSYKQLRPKNSTSRAGKSSLPTTNLCQSCQASYYRLRDGFTHSCPTSNYAITGDNIASVKSFTKKRKNWKNRNGSCLTRCTQKRESSRKRTIAGSTGVDRVPIMCTEWLVISFSVLFW